MLQGKVGRTSAQPNGLLNSYWNRFCAGRRRESEEGGTVSARRPGQCATTKYVSVQMGNALSGRFAIVDKDTIAALGDTHLVGDFRGRVKKMTEQRHIQL